MYRMISIVWIAAGVLIGWFGIQVVMAERRWAAKVRSDEE